MDNDRFRHSVAAVAREMRNRSGRSLTEARGAGGVSTPSASQVENGNRMPSTATLYRMARGCGFTLTQAAEMIEEVYDGQPATIYHARELAKKTTQQPAERGEQ